MDEQEKETHDANIAMRRMVGIIDEHITEQMASICINLGIPIRVFMGQSD